MPIKNVNECPTYFSKVVASSNSNFKMVLNINNLIMTGKLHSDASVTGGAYDFDRATTSLTQKLISSTKKVTLVRHGLSSWNDEGRVQVCGLSYFTNLFLYYVSVAVGSYNIMTMDV